MYSYGEIPSAREIKGLFGNVNLVILFVFFLNTCEWKKCVKIHIILFKNWKLLPKCHTNVISVFIYWLSNSRPRHVRSFLPALCEQFIEVAQYLLEGRMTIFGNLENSTYSVFIFYFLGIHTGKTLFWFIFCFRFRLQYSKKMCEWKWNMKTTLSHFYFQQNGFSSKYFCKNIEDCGKWLWVY